MRSVPRRRRVLLAACCLALLATADAASGQISIDDFTDAQAGTGTLDTANVIGGERDIRALSGATCTVGGGTAQLTGPAFSACSFAYDGNDDDPSFPDTVPGFAPTDFTAGAQDRLEIPTTETSGACALLVQLCDNDATPTCGSASQAMSTGTATFLFSDPAFSGVDFTAITFVLVNVTVQGGGAGDCSVGEPVTVPVELMSFDVS